MEKTNEVLNNINTNKYFVGVIMIILTIGGRFIIGELDEKTREKVTDNQVFRKLFIFCAFFMATRDLIAATALTLIFSVIISSLINHNKELYDETDSETDDETDEEEEEEEESKDKLNNILQLHV
tara:strand:+ start:6282 stop:6656 length:375 start_codon:yes stop_codon:yes gene_type:complete